jgi:hypothetical protein
LRAAFGQRSKIGLSEFGERGGHVCDFIQNGGWIVIPDAVGSVFVGIVQSGPTVETFAKRFYGRMEVQVDKLRFHVV